MEASGLVRRRKEGSGFYDAFRGRLMFPIHNESGKVIAFRRTRHARRGSAEVSELARNAHLQARHPSYITCIARAKRCARSDRVVLVEGYMDVIGVYAAGVKEVVASCGTALTNAQVRSDASPRRYGGGEFRSG